MLQRMIAMSQQILFTMHLGILDLDGMLGISLGNALTSKIILELRHVPECIVTNRGHTGKPRSQLVLIGIGRSLTILEVVLVTGVLMMEEINEIGQLVVNQEREEKGLRRWKIVLKSWKKR
jgi:hypothetical protein